MRLSEQALLLNEPFNGGIFFGGRILENGMRGFLSECPASGQYCSDAGQTFPKYERKLLEMSGLGECGLGTGVA